MRPKNSDIYYVEKTNSTYSSSHVTLVHTSKQAEVLVNEYNTEDQSISIVIYKIGENKEELPKTSEWSTVKSISKERFYENYNSVLRHLQGVDISEGEYYLTAKYDSNYDTVAWFSADGKKRYYLEICISDTLESFDISIEYARGWRRRPYVKKKGKPIEANLIFNIFKQVFHFLYDPNNYEINYVPLAEQFKKYLEEDTSYLHNATPVFINQSAIIEKIKQRIAKIEQRLIESDKDSSEDRIKMRGELEGLRFAIRIIQASQEDTGNDSQS